MASFRRYNDVTITSCVRWDLDEEDDELMTSWHGNAFPHYDDVIMSAIASQITSLTIVYSTVYPGADQRKHQSSASLAFMWGIHRGPVNSPHKWPVTRKMFPFHDVILVRIHRSPMASSFVAIYPLSKMTGPDCRVTDWSLLNGNMTNPCSDDFNHCRLQAWVDLKLNQDMYKDRRYCWLSS